jgi:folate-binding Fe-S cluster repair protein YgfZ
MLARSKHEGQDKCKFLSGILMDEICRKIKRSSHRTNYCHIVVKVLEWRFVLGSTGPEYPLITGLPKTAVNIRDL